MRVPIGLFVVALSGAVLAAPPAGPPPLPGASTLEAVPVLPGTDDAALTEWRDALLALYRAAHLAPFDVHPAAVETSGTAWSIDLGRDVGRYRVKPDGSMRGLELLGVELPGAHDKALELLAPLRELHPWALRTDGQVIPDCHVEISRATRAELCLDLPDIDRAAPSVVTTELRVLLVCPPTIKPDDIALAYLSPTAPAPFVPVTSEAAPSVGYTFNGEAASRELVCTEGRAYCVSMTDDGELTMIQGNRAIAVAPEELVGFALKGPASRWTGVEHKPSGLRILRSAIGTYHGLPPEAQLRDFFAAGDCLLWQLRSPTTKKYPARIDLGALCLGDGAWLDGTYAMTTLRGNVRRAAQGGRIDDVASRCTYTQ